VGKVGKGGIGKGRKILGIGLWTLDINLGHRTLDQPMDVFVTSSQSLSVSVSILILRFNSHSQSHYQSVPVPISFSASAVLLDGYSILVYDMNDIDVNTAALFS